MRVRFLAVIVLVLFSLAALAQPTPQSLDNGHLELVVALFRHGIRAPLKGFAESAGAHSGEAWPTLDDWGVGKPGQLGRNWGFLTNHGRDVVTTLGSYYGTSYRKSFGGADFSVFLWADVDQRTQATASALAAGFTSSGLKDVQVQSLPPGAAQDLLFHPFKAGCGTVDVGELDKITNPIRANASEWWTQPPNVAAATQLTTALSCTDDSTTHCTPLEGVKDEVCSCENTMSKCGTANCDAPIYWKGRFAYGSSASEAFLLEYGNGMKAGWGRVDAGDSTMLPKLRTMLQLHEFYFDQTQRQRYVAQIEGSNLIREIQAVLNRKTGSCQHAPIGAQFVGLVGHDTNIANIASLLGIGWTFAGTPLAGIPNDDPLPAGALVFELWHMPHNLFLVRVGYIAQDLEQMRGNTSGAVRLEAMCGGQLVCIMSLRDFNTIADKAKNKNFRSRCRGGKQVCGAM